MIIDRDKGIEILSKLIYNKHCDLKIKFPGEITSVSSEESARFAAEALIDEVQNSFKDGVCFRCKRRIPCDWPPKESLFILPIPIGWQLIGYATSPKDDCSFSYYLCDICELFNKQGNNN